MADHSYKWQTGEEPPRDPEVWDVWGWWNDEWDRMFPDGLACGPYDELTERKFNYLSYLRDLAFGDVHGSGQP